MKTILVVDDDDNIRRVLRRMLEQAGHRVIEAESAAAAILVVTGDDPPDAVVCDVVMPGKTGLAFYRELVEQAPALRQRVVFLTGAASDRGVHDTIEAMGVPLLAKLDDLQLVIDAVRIALLRR